VALRVGGLHKGVGSKKLGAQITPCKIIELGVKPLEDDRQDRGFDPSLWEFF
jgi:hypothetical protein